MRRFQQWVYLLLAFVLTMSACTSTGPVNTDTAWAAGDITKARSLLISASQADPSSAILEEDECLNCHSDKDLLVQTAKPEELAESESKGVG